LIEPGEGFEGVLCLDLAILAFFAEEVLRI